MKITGSAESVFSLNETLSEKHGFLLTGKIWQEYNESRGTRVSIMNSLFCVKTGIPAMRKGD